MNAKRKLLISMIVLLSAGLACAQEIECPPGCSPGRWSKDAVDLSSRSVKAPYESRDLRVRAPDPKRVAWVVKDHWWIEMPEGKLSARPKGAGVLYPAEIAWSKDSQALFITQSVGFSTGYETQVYQIEGGRLISLERLNTVVRRDFDRRHKCVEGDIGNAPNVAGLKWLENSDRLLIVAEVPPVGICKDAGYFGGYEISISSGHIVRRFSPKELEDRWGDTLGDRLRGDFESLSIDGKSAEP